ncbi:hypothetical protein EVAR_563_1 [Eumeta japonica]|uniref:BESS domain-containing protein n=1 Tax=Eumeta variegata TaxID=151549 RepID=A0A4C1SB36_EUMVA|nr:hypothetical protein EVAR_563_1 [Eumeta japonica]
MGDSDLDAARGRGRVRYVGRRVGCAGAAPVRRRVQQSSQSSTETETETQPPLSQSTAFDQQSCSQTVNPSNSKTLTVAVDQSRGSAQANTTNEQAPSPSLQNQQSSSPKAAINRPHKTSQTKRKCVEQNETLTALQRLENIATAINNTGSKEKDEFYYFGQSVAAQLRSLPLNNALNMQTKIQALLRTERSELSISYSEPSTPYSNTSINTEEIAASSADDRFTHTPYTQSNTTEITFDQESG